MNGKKINEVLQLGAKHALYREDGKWYHRLKIFPGVLFDQNGYVLFESEESYKSESKLKQQKDLHVIGGIESLSGYEPFTDGQKQLLFAHQYKSNNHDRDGEEVIRLKREFDIILRDRQLVGRLKKLYKNTCQICQSRIKIGNKEFYSEVHHIVPLGRPHNGLDKIENMLCVCPNCHVRLDFGALRLDRNSLYDLKHTIDAKNIDYLK